MNTRHPERGLLSAALYGLAAIAFVASLACGAVAWGGIVVGQVWLGWPLLGTGAGLIGVGCLRLAGWFDGRPEKR